VDDVPYLDKFTVGRKSQVLCRGVKETNSPISPPRELLTFSREEFNASHYLMFPNFTKCLHKKKQPTNKGKLNDLVLK